MTARQVEREESVRTVFEANTIDEALAAVVKTIDSENLLDEWMHIEIQWTSKLYEDGDEGSFDVVVRGNRARTEAENG